MSCATSVRYKEIKKTVISIFWCGYKTHNGGIIKSIPNYQIAVASKSKRKKVLQGPADQMNFSF